MFPLTSRAIYQFWCELPSLSGYSRRDFCLLSNTMGLNSALNVELTAPKIFFGKLNSNVSFQLLKIIHRHCCEQFYVGKKVVPV